MKKVYRKDYNCKEIAPNIYMIDEFNIVNCYLVIGEKRALLIDCGTGIGDLLGFVKTLTDLPISVAATHGHVDHIGGAPQFKEIYLHPDDFKMVGFMLKLRIPFLIYASKIKKFCEQYHVSITHIPAYKKRDLILKPIKDGDIIDLGGKTLTVYHTPGHTPGSVVFHSNEDNILFTGDNINVDLWLHVPYATDVETWLKGAEFTAELMKNNTVYPGHGFNFTPHETVMKTISLGKKILRENHKNSKVSKLCKIEDRNAGVDIQYRSGNIYR